MGAAPAELVRDRLAEFQRLAREKGGLPPLAAGAGASGPPAASGGSGGRTRLLQQQQTLAGSGAASSSNGFMREFFTEVNAVQELLKQGREGVQQMESVLGEALQATARERQEAAMARLEALARETQARALEAKGAIEMLSGGQADATQADATAAASAGGDGRRPLPPPRSEAERRIRANLRQALARKHQQLVLDLQRSQQDFKRMLERQQEREMRLLCPEASDAEVRDMIDAGETSAQLVVRKMAGAHAMVLEEVQRIRDKHQDILRLEQSIADLAAMFNEMAVLVEAQGELLNAIEVHVRDTNEYTGKAVKELVTAKNVQRNTRKWMCCTMVFLMVLIVAILFPILIKR